jgi:chromosome segregation ATPase
MEVEGHLEKIKILQSTLDMYSSKSDDCDNIINKLENKIVEMKNDNLTLTNKYRALHDEMEINNKNVRKNFILETTIKNLTEENEKLAAEIKYYKENEDLKIKYRQLEVKLKETNERFEQTKIELENLKLENAKITNENFEKYTEITNLTNELKIKSHKIEELTNEKANLKKNLDALASRLKETEHSIKSKSSLYETQINNLKKEIEKLIKENAEMKKDVSDSKEELKVNNYIISKCRNINNIRTLQKHRRSSFQRKTFPY